ncbi:MAG: cation diffusion facilitator family transporter [Coxiellaceae bacterium]|nr:cation diffusion facilitator family transporter [Coxiellaceae bacterium]
MKATPYYHVIRKVTFVNASVNLLLAVVKILVGWFGYSHALIADGLHSLSDLIADALVFIAAKLGSQSPDEDHPYGHRRIETLGAIIIAVVLITVGALIVLDAIGNLSRPQAHHSPEWIVMITAIGSIIINEGLYHYGKHFGKKINSQLLISTAWHNRSDAMTSVIVVVAVAGAMFHVQHLDVIGALIIGLMILYAGGKMIWTCFRELIDTGADDAMLQQIRTAIHEVSGVVAVHQLRTRSLGGEIFIDIHIQVDPRISVSEGHFIGEQVHDHLIKTIDHVSDVTVHIDPEDDETQQPCEHLPDRPTLLNKLNDCWQHLPEYTAIERIIIHYYDGKIDLDIYINKKDINHDIRQQYFDALPPSMEFIKQINLYHAI